MAETTRFVGESGSTYSFEVYPWGQEFIPFGAVYAITTGINQTPLYFGQTSDMSERFDNHHKLDCFKRNGVTHICVLQQNSDSARLRIEADLKGRHHPVCNG